MKNKKEIEKIYKILMEKHHKCRFVTVRRSTFRYHNGRPVKFKKHIFELGLQVENQVLVYTKNRKYEWRSLDIPHIEITKVYRGIPHWAESRKKLKDLYANNWSFWIARATEEVAASDGTENNQ